MINDLTLQSPSPNEIPPRPDPSHAFDENEYYLSLRNDRKLYYNKDIHIHILLMIFSLMLSPRYNLVSTVTW